MDQLDGEIQITLMFFYPCIEAMMDHQQWQNRINEISGDLES